MEGKPLGGPRATAVLQHAGLAGGVEMQSSSTVCMDASEIEGSGEKR